MTNQKITFLDNQIQKFQNELKNLAGWQKRRCINKQIEKKLKI